MVWFNYHHANLDFIFFNGDAHQHSGKFSRLFNDLKSQKINCIQLTLRQWTLTL
jgi:hypothetical protein